MTDAAELEWIAWTTPITTSLGAALAASDFSGRTVACRQHILADTIGVEVRAHAGMSAGELDESLAWLVSEPADALCDMGGDLIHNRHHVGVETWPAFTAITGLALYGREVVVVGFGPVGQGVAARARDLGAVVTVVDLDPVRLVQAQHDGCRVAEKAAALRSASVIVTATGFDGVLGEQQLSQVADGAILVNVGHSDREIDVDWLDRRPSTPVRRHLERYELDGRWVYLLNRGSLVNLAAGLGIGAPQLFDPFAAIMLLGLDAILNGQTADLPNGVQRYPRPLEARVARALATGSA